MRMPEFNYTRVIEGGGELWVCFGFLIHRFNILFSVLNEFQVGARSILELMWLWKVRYRIGNCCYESRIISLVFLWERQWDTFPNQTVSQIYRHLISSLKEFPGKRTEELSRHRELLKTLVWGGGGGEPWNFVRAHMRVILFLGIEISDLEGRWILGSAAAVLLHLVLFAVSFVVNLPVLISSNWFDSRWQLGIMIQIYILDEPTKDERVLLRTFNFLVVELTQLRNAYDADCQLMMLGKEWSRGDVLIFGIIVCGAQYERVEWSWRALIQLKQHL